jgi:outer membrane protein
MSKTLVTTILAAAGLMATALAGPVRAQDAESQSPWQLRVRALGVLPASSGSTVNVLNTPSLSSPNSGLSIGNSIVPELDVSYFFTRNVSAELVLGVTPHNITGTGALSNLNVGSSWLLPPTLLAQYHFTDFGRFKPYVGIGVNYTVFFNQNPAYTPTNGLSVTSLNINNTLGGAAQVGFDYMLDQHWGVNVDVKKLLLRPSYSAVVNGTIPVSGTAVIDPWLIGVGLTYRF